MKSTFNRRELLQTGAIAAAGTALPIPILAARKKSVLVFTKSSGWEHDVVKRVDGKASIVDQTITSLGGKHGFDVTATKDGRAFDSKDLHSYVAVFFFTTGDLTTAGTDSHSPMPPQGKQALLDAIRDRDRRAGRHAAT